MNIKYFLLLPVLLLLTVSTVPAQDVKKYELALETQLSCSQTPQPSKAIKALQRGGIIAQQSYFAPDAIKYFRTIQPLEVWRMKVVSVFGWDYHQMFGHGPGTSPPIMIGIVVPYPQVQVKAILSRMHIANMGDIVIEPANETTLIHRKSKYPILTDIYCGKFIIFNN